MVLAGEYRDECVRDGISISTELSIVALDTTYHTDSGEVIVNCKENGRFITFKPTNSSTLLTLNGLHIKNARGTGPGGALLVESGAISIISCWFENTISVVDDRSKSSVGTSGGGAIAVITTSPSSVMVHNSKFENCSTNSAGGAILVAVSSPSPPAVQTTIPFAI